MIYVMNICDEYEEYMMLFNHFQLSSFILRKYDLQAVGQYLYPSPLQNLFWNQTQCRRKECRKHYIESMHIIIPNVIQINTQNITIIYVISQLLLELTRILITLSSPSTMSSGRTPLPVENVQVIMPIDADRMQYSRQHQGHTLQFR